MATYQFVILVSEYGRFLLWPIVSFIQAMGTLYLLYTLSSQNIKRREKEADENIQALLQDHGNEYNSLNNGQHTFINKISLESYDPKKKLLQSTDLKEKDAGQNLKTLQSIQNVGSLNSSVIGDDEKDYYNDEKVGSSAKRAGSNFWKNFKTIKTGSSQQFS